jgi:hypothetical protein
MQRLTIGSPSVRTNASAAFDPIRGRVMIFGGTGPLGAQLDDIWSYGFEAPGVAVETCGPTDDSDGDGFRGCADPDCWASCTACPPGLSCL